MGSPNAQQGSRAAAQQRRVRVAEQYVRGLSFAAIARVEGVSATTIGKDMAVVRAEWSERYTADLHARKLLELAKVDAIEALAAEQFARSCLDATETKRELLGDGPRPEFGDGQMRVRGQSGNPAYLRVMLDCVERRCKILGIDAPVKVAETDKAGNDLTPEARAERARAVMAQFGWAGRTLSPSEN